MTRMRSIVITAGAGLLITLCACGNGPPEVSGSSSGGQAAGVGGASLGTPATKVIANSSDKFAPGNITVSTGEIIQWTVAQDSPPHNITFDSQSSLDSPSAVGPGSTWEVKFSAPGTYPYHCTIHAGMNGQITVTSGGGGGTGTSPSASGAASPSP
ncbi:MAG: cupredoxin domain-containing protein [Candidatus Dormibacteria bacterium]